jgi:hypothetical protein
VQISFRFDRRSFLLLLLILKMRIKTILIISCLLASLLSLGQTNINGTITDSQNGRRIAGAHVYFQDCQKGTISNQNGEFDLSDWSESLILIISHISYQDTSILLKKNQKKLDIKLIRKNQKLKGVSVMGSAIPLLKDKPWFISDYEISDKGLLLLGYPKKKLKSPTFFSHRCTWRSNL